MLSTGSRNVSRPACSHPSPVAWHSRTSLRALRSRSPSRRTASSGCTERRFARPMPRPPALPTSLGSLSRLRRLVGRVEEAGEAGQQAVALLEALPPGREVALAYNNLSHIYVAIEEAEGTIAWGTRALELAARLDDTENLVYALT